MVHDRDAVGHRERLLLVVGDVEERDPDLALDRLQLHLHLLAQLQVERAERLVEQQHRGPVDERPRERHALALAARELVRPGLLAAGQLHELERLGHARLDLRPAPPCGACSPNATLLHDVEVLEQRVGLEDRVDVALVGRHRRHRLALEEDLALGRLLEARHHPQRRRLAAARRARAARRTRPVPIVEVEVRRPRSRRRSAWSRPRSAPPPLMRPPSRAARRARSRLPPDQPRQQHREPDAEHRDREHQRADRVDRRRHAEADRRPDPHRQRLRRLAGGEERQHEVVERERERQQRRRRGSPATAPAASTSQTVCMRVAPRSIAACSTSGSSAASRARTTTVT